MHFQPQIPFLLTASFSQLSRPSIDNHCFLSRHHFCHHVGSFTESKLHCKSFISCQLRPHQKWRLFSNPVPLITPFYISNTKSTHDTNFISMPKVDKFHSAASVQISSPKHSSFKSCIQIITPQFQSDNCIRKIPYKNATKHMQNQLQFQIWTHQKLPNLS